MFNWQDFMNDFPYTNFSDVNVSWFLNKFKQIFDEWEGLYNQMLSWKTATDEYNATWRTEQEQAFRNWENNFQTAIDEWKSQTETDIGTWESNTLTNLETWKNAFITQYNALKAEVEQIADDAETAKNSAQASATSAQQSADSASATAESLSSSLTQITTNTADIEDLKTQIATINNMGADLLSGLSWVLGGIGDTGSNYNVTTRIRIPDAIADSPSLVNYKYITVSCDSGYLGVIRFYENNLTVKSYLSSASFMEGNSNIAVPENALFARFVLYRTDGASMSNTEGEHVTFMGVDTFIETISKNSNDLLTVTKIINDSGYDANNKNIWEYNGISSSTGINSPASNRLRTSSYIAKNVRWVEAKEGYQYSIFGYTLNRGALNFEGVYNGTDFVNSLTFHKKRIYITDLPNYIYRLVIKNDNNTAITDKNIGKDAVTMFAYTDAELNKYGVSADSGYTGDLKRSIKNNPAIMYMCRDGRVNANVPPDSVYAIKASAENEYDYIRFTVTRTSDGYFVAVHDTTINNLAREVGGAEIADTVTVTESTLSKLNSYDWGIKYGEQYEGLKVPELEQCIKYATLYNLKVALDFHNTAFTDDEIDYICNLLANYGQYEALIMVTDSTSEPVEGGCENKNRFALKNPRFSHNYFNTFKNMQNYLNKIEKLLNGKNKVYLYLKPSKDVPTSEMINFAMQNGFDIMVSEISSITELANWGFNHGVTLFECHNITNIKEAVNNYANSMI